MSAALPESTLVVGFARTGQAVARVLGTRGVEVVAIDDSPDDVACLEADRLGVNLLVTPGAPALSALVGAAGLVVVSPGVPPVHPVFHTGRRTGIVSEIELAYRLAEIPIVAITGTNGKTTVTALVAEMLSADGRRTRGVGNFGPTLIEAVVDPKLDLCVAEVSSFQLALTKTFRPRVAAFLNIAEDHLDWHADFDDYLAAKARIFAFQRSSDVAVVNGDDETVIRAARHGRARGVVFGRTRGDYHLEGERLVGPGGETLALRSDLIRCLPHDELNALAALATAREAGASAAACRSALQSFAHLPHRVAEIATVDGVTYYDDSKATTPSATIACVSGFATSVLICGGRNKGLDLAEIRRFLDGHRAHLVRGVVAIGEAAEEVAAAFADYEVVHASSMREAVRAARDLACAGDAVLLSPGCASFDWYRSYEERGEDFVAAVRSLHSGLASTGGGQVR